jgi:hypothetical protein
MENLLANNCRYAYDNIAFIPAPTNVINVIEVEVEM